MSSKKNRAKSSGHAQGSDKDSHPPDTKKDSSGRVHQRDKVSFHLNIRDLEWTDKQKKFIDIALDKKTRLVFVKGPSGSSKSLISVYAALKLLNEKKISDIIYLRSAVESSESSLGFLPGSADEKLAFYNMPFLDKIDELLPQAEGKRLLTEGRAHCFPINFVRGLNWNAKAVILDEAQNSSYKEIVTSLTRLGEFTRCFVLADPMQTDLKGPRGGGFMKFFDSFKDDPAAQAMGIHTFEFNNTDIKRSELVAFLVDRIEKINNDKPN